ncbi:hypothetical protein CAEBREN_09897 [Caenorhabditis brenneri]|uniref:Uncharacterized protein n=1 Tax=Caenorhabditis brenneri TaxID=135651 RepID=G0NQK3_CAEBE|nr:hypothetical protein CAEBREN_09897 [Caenorhabditis brenneri]
MRFKLIFLLYLATFPTRTASDFAKTAKDHANVANVQKGASIAQDAYNDPVGAAAGAGYRAAKNAFKKHTPIAGPVFSIGEDIAAGKFPIEGTKQIVDSMPPGLPPLAKTGIKAGLDLLGGIANGENVFKVLGNVIKEYANPVNVLKNVASEVLGPVAKIASGFFGFLGSIFGGGGPSIPDSLDPIKQSKAAFEKVLSGDVAGAFDTIKNFAGSREDKEKLVEAFNEKVDIENAKTILENKKSGLPAVEETVKKLKPLLDMDEDDILNKLNPLDKLSDLLGDGLNGLGKKMGIELPAGLDKLRKDLLNAENLLKAGQSALGIDLPFGMNGFLSDPYRDDGPYGKKGMYGINGVYGPDGIYGPNSKIGPFGPNGLFGPNGPNGLNGPFGPNGAFNPMGLLNKGLQQVAPKLTFLHNPITAKLLENTPFGSKGSHGLNGLFGPNGPYGPFGDFGPTGPFGPKGPFGPNGDNSPIKEWIEKFQNKIPKPNCKLEIQDVIRKFKDKLTELLKNEMPEPLKKLFGDKFDKLKKALDKGKDFLKKLDELKDKIPKIPEPNPIKKVKDMYEKVRKFKKGTKKPLKPKYTLPPVKPNATSTTTVPPEGMDLPGLVKDDVDKVLTCLEMPPNPGQAAFDTVKSLPQGFESIFTPFSGMADTMHQIHNRKDIKGGLSGFNDILGKIDQVKDGNYDFLKKDKQFHDTRKFVGSLEMSFDKLRQPPSFLSEIGLLGGSGPAISSMTDYFDGIKIGSDLCDKETLEDPIERIKNAVDVADAVDEVKKDKTIDKVKKIYDEVKEFVKKAKEVEKAYELFIDDVNESEEDKEIFKGLHHMEPLLEKTINGIENFEGLNQIREIRNEVETVIKSEKTIQEVIKYVKDPTERVILDIVWKDFRKTAQNLTIIQNKIDKLERILAEVNETNILNQKEVSNYNESSEVKEFIYVYIKAAEMNFTESVDLQSYKESLKLLDNSTRERREVKEIYDSFEKVYEATSSINWNRIHLEFQEMPEAIIQSKGEYQAMTKKYEEEDNWWLIWLLIGITSSIACSSCLLILFFFWWRRRQEEEKPYVCVDWKYSYVQMQDARLEMNKMDSNGRTDLYNAVLDKKWYKVQDLIENGALVDATCGTFLRTALFELVLMKDVDHAKEFLDAGAYILQPDVSGNYPEQWSDENGFHLLFDEYSKEDQRRRVIPPNAPRPYEILVVNGDYLPRKERKKLPKRIRKKITWGYKPGMDLDKFTHIVVPPKYTKKENTLTLDEEDLFIWKCVASLSNIMPESWIDAILRSDTYIEDDHVHMLIHMEYADNEHEEALLKLKTDLHMGRPKFLTNTKITVLETKDKKKAEKKKEWEEILKAFGAEITAKPVMDTEKTLLPYNSLYPYRDPNKKVQNSCWILKYEDSKIKPAWRADPEKCTLAPFRFVLECIARYQILPFDNQVVPLSEENSPDGSDKTGKTGSTMKSKETASKSRETATGSKEPVTGSKEPVTGSKEPAS